MGDCSESQIQVLLVEDNPMFAEILGQVLQREGCPFVLATSVSEALLAARNQCFLAVVCDYNLPKVIGSCLLKELHNLAPATPILLISGNEPEDLAALLASGVVAQFIPKPFSRAVLMQALHRVAPNLPHRF